MRFQSASNLEVVQLTIQGGSGIFSGCKRTGVRKPAQENLRQQLSNFVLSAPLYHLESLKSFRGCRLHPSIFTVLENKTHNLKKALISLLHVNRNTIFLMKITFWGSNLLIVRQLDSHLFLHSTCCCVSLWLKHMKKMRLSLSPSLPLWQAL